MVVPDFRSFLNEKIDMFSLESCGADSNEDFRSLKSKLNYRGGAIFQSFLDKYISHEEALNKLDEMILRLAKEGEIIIDFVKTQSPKLCLTSIKANPKTYKLVKIVKFDDAYDCVMKLDNKLKLEKLIS